MSKFNLPVTWEVCGMVEIEADTLEEAVDIFNADPDSIPLPDDYDYVDGSFDLSCPEIEYIRAYNRPITEYDSCFSYTELNKWADYYKEHNNNWSMQKLFYEDEITHDIVIQKEDTIETLTEALFNEDTDMIVFDTDTCVGNFDTYDSLFCLRTNYIYFVLKSQDKLYQKGDVVVVRGRRATKEEIEKIKHFE